MKQEQQQDNKRQRLDVCLTFKITEDLYNKLQAERKEKGDKIGVEIKMPDYLRSLLIKGVSEDS